MGGCKSHFKDFLHKSDIVKKFLVPLNQIIIYVNMKEDVRHEKYKKGKKVKMKRCEGSDVKAVDSGLKGPGFNSCPRQEQRKTIFLIFDLLVRTY